MVSMQSFGLLGNWCLRCVLIWITVFLVCSWLRTRTDELGERMRLWSVLSLWRLVASSQALSVTFFCFVRTLERLELSSDKTGARISVSFGQIVGVVQTFSPHASFSGMWR